MTSQTHITTETLKSIVDSLFEDDDGIEAVVVEEPVYLIRSYLPPIEPVIIASPQRKKGKKGKYLKDWE